MLDECKRVDSTDLFIYKQTALSHAKAKMLHSTHFTRPTYQSTQALQQIAPAGLTTGFNETAKDVMCWDAKPSTPELLRPYTHYARQEPGTITKHFGSARDSVPQGPFGAKTKASLQSAEECIRCYPESEIARWKLEQEEEVYAR